jgi:acyl-coenzyme A thioesterase PaaI-like protein
LKLRFVENEGIVTTRFTPLEAHVGFKAVTHGGLLATVLDEIMVWACAVRTKQFAYCAELGVRYLSPAVPGVELMGTARLEEDRRGRLFLASAQLADPAGTLVATGTGKYRPLKEEAAQAMAEDFVGSADTLFD